MPLVARFGGFFQVFFIRLDAKARAFGHIDKADLYLKPSTPVCIAGKQPVGRVLLDLLGEKGYVNVLAIPDAICAKMGVTGAISIASCGQE